MNKIRSTYVKNSNILSLKGLLSASSPCPSSLSSLAGTLNPVNHGSFISTPLCYGEWSRVEVEVKVEVDDKGGGGGGGGEMR